MVLRGTVAGMTGLTVEAVDFPAPVAGQCVIRCRSGFEVPAEVIGFHRDRAVLMPLGDMEGIACGDPVECLAAHATVPVGDHLLGRTINAYGDPIDEQGSLMCQVRLPLNGARVQPLRRARIQQPIGTGLRVLDALLTCGCGQRLGIFSGPGVGKSVLLGMIARYTSADVTVIGLIGERGREVREFIEKDLGPEGLKKSVVVVSTSDEPAPIRVRAGFVATTVAEYFRNQGKNVLLLMDSVTRVAMAQRQIGLAMGEPPATKGYTPSVFSLLPRLAERCGCNDRGTITGFYTVLVEGDDFTEPVSDTMRGILDGHISLSRDLANRGHYPAINVLDSISRVMSDIVDQEHLQAARDLTRLVAIYRDIEDLVNIGAYAPGANPEHDLAVQSISVINQFLQQGMKESISFAQASAMLKQLVKAIRDVSQQNSPRQQAQQVGTTAGT